MAEGLDRIKENFEMKQSRRGFLGHLGMGAIRGSAVLAVNAIAGGIQYLRIKDSKEQQEQESSQGLPANQDKLEPQFQDQNQSISTEVEVLQKVETLPNQDRLESRLKVRYFAKEILGTAQNIVSSAPEKKILAAMAGWYFGDAVGGYFLRERPVFSNRVIGVACMLGGKILDFVSTVIFADQMSDPRFDEYGFGVYVRENNPLLPPNPTRRDVFAAASWQVPLSTLGGFWYPFFGRGYLGASPMIASNNIDAAYFISTAMNLGDNIKDYIKEGRNEQFIRDFLKSESLLD